MSAGLVDSELRDSALDGPLNGGVHVGGQRPAEPLATGTPGVASSGCVPPVMPYMAVET